jgi:hypothetical protein
MNEDPIHSPPSAVWYVEPVQPNDPGYYTNVPVVYPGDNNPYITSVPELSETTLFVSISVFIIAIWSRKRHYR